MIEFIVVLFLFFIVSILAMIGTVILFDFAIFLAPLIIVALLIFGVVVGFGVAIKNTYSVYMKIYKDRRIKK